MTHNHKPPDWEAYAKTFKQMEKSLNKSSRERQLERTFGEPMKRLLIRVLDDHDGRKRPALRKLNDRLRENDDYDDESYGVISPNTFYDWCDRFGIE